MKKERKVQYKRWNEKNMRLAVESVHEKGISIQKSANIFNVPRSTLRERVRGNVPMDAHAGARKKLDSDQESALARYIGHMSTIGHPLTLGQVRMFAWCTVQTRGSNTFGRSLPSDNWWKLFRESNKHADLKLRSSSLSKRRHLSFSEDAKDFTEYFLILKEVMDKYNFHERPESVFCCGENTVVFNDLSQVTVIPSHLTKQYRSCTCKVTLFEGASAAGTEVMPFVVFCEDFPQGDYRCGAFYGKSQDGRFNSELMLDWFRNCFLPYCPADKCSSRPVLLLIDGYSMHVSLKLVESAIDEHVIVLLSPPQSRYAHLPLGMEVFSTLQSELNSAAELGCAMHGTEWKVKEDIAKILKIPLVRSMSVANIQDGFRKCGILPLNPEAVSEQVVHANLEGFIEETDSSVILESVEMDDPALIDCAQTETTSAQPLPNGSKELPLSLDRLEHNPAHVVETPVSDSPSAKRVMRIDVLHEVVSSIMEDNDVKTVLSEKSTRRRRGASESKVRKNSPRVKQGIKKGRKIENRSLSVKLATPRGRGSRRHNQRFCHGCMRKLDDDSREERTKWVGCTSSCCSHWTCDDCHRVDFASAAEASNVMEYTLDEL